MSWEETEENMRAYEDEMESSYYDFCAMQYFEGLRAIEYMLLKYEELKKVLEE